MMDALFRRLFAAETRTVRLYGNLDADAARLLALEQGLRVAQQRRVFGTVYGSDNRGYSVLAKSACTGLPLANIQVKVSYTDANGTTFNLPNMVTGEDGYIYLPLDASYPYGDPDTEWDIGAYDWTKTVSDPFAGPTIYRYYFQSRTYPAGTPLADTSFSLIMGNPPVYQPNYGDWFCLATAIGSREANFSKPSGYSATSDAGTEVFDSNVTTLTCATDSGGTTNFSNGGAAALLTTNQTINGHASTLLIDMRPNPMTMKLTSGANNWTVSAVPSEIDPFKVDFDFSATGATTAVFGATSPIVHVLEVY